MEIWKDIPGYEGLYQVSNLGNVKSLKRLNGRNIKIPNRILRNSISGRGYCYVKLYKEKENKTIAVHQLVAIAFLNHVSNGHKSVIDHINSIKTDNRLNNLKLTSNRENVSKERRNSKKYSSKFTGVSWRKDTNNWNSRININGKSKSLGSFDSETKAHEAYQIALLNL